MYISLLFRNLAFKSRVTCSISCPVLLLSQFLGYLSSTTSRYYRLSSIMSCVLECAHMYGEMHTKGLPSLRMHPAVQLRHARKTTQPYCRSLLHLLSPFRETLIADASRLPTLDALARNEYHMSSFRGIPQSGQAECGVCPSPCPALGNVSWRAVGLGSTWSVIIWRTNSIRSAALGCTSRELISTTPRPSCLQFKRLHWLIWMEGAGPCSSALRRVLCARARALQSPHVLRTAGNWCVFAE